MAKSSGDVADKVRSLHKCLNELYAIDSNWRAWGEWPDEVTGSILHRAATAAEISAAEGKFGHRFPPSFVEFLQLHSAWEHFWGDFTLVGTGPAGTEPAIAKIVEYAGEQTADLQKELGNDFSAQGIRAWEAEQERFIHLADQLVIGTDFSGALWVFDTGSRRADGEMTLKSWDISYGAQEPEFANFGEFLDWAMFEAEDRLHQTREAIENPTESTDDDDD